MGVGVGECWGGGRTVLIYNVVASHVGWWGVVGLSARPGGGAIRRSSPHEAASVFAHSFFVAYSPHIPLI